MDRSHAPRAHARRRAVAAVAACEWYSAGIAVLPILADRVEVKRGQINYGFPKAENVT